MKLKLFVHSKIFFTNMDFNDILHKHSLTRNLTPNLICMFIPMMILSGLGLSSFLVAKKFNSNSNVCFVVNDGSLQNAILTDSQTWKLSFPLK